MEKIIISSILIFIVCTGSAWSQSITKQDQLATPTSKVIEAKQKNMQEQKTTRFSNDNSQLYKRIICCSAHTDHTYQKVLFDRSKMKYRRYKNITQSTTSENLKTTKSQ